MVYLSAHIQSVSGIKVWKHSFLLVWKNFTAGTSVYYIQRELRIVISCTDNSSQNHIFFDCLGITGKHRKLLTWIIIQRIDSVFHSLYSCKHGLNHWVRNIPSNELYLKPWWKKKKNLVKKSFFNQMLKHNNNNSDSLHIHGFASYKHLPMCYQISSAQFFAQGGNWSEKWGN